MATNLIIDLQHRVLVPHALMETLELERRNTATGFKRMLIILGT